MKKEWTLILKKYSKKKNVSAFKIIIFFWLWAIVSDFDFLKGFFILKKVAGIFFYAFTWQHWNITRRVAHVSTYLEQGNLLSFLRSFSDSFLSVRLRLFIILLNNIFFSFSLIQLCSHRCVHWKCSCTSTFHGKWSVLLTKISYNLSHNCTTKMDVLDLILLVTFIALLIIFYANYRRKYWARKKIASMTPSNLIMGSTGDVFLKKVSLYNYHANMYERLAPHKYGGYYNFFTPVLVVRDPDLIKTIFTKDFNCFMDRGQPLDEKNPLSQNLFNLKGEKWRILRHKLTPTFTSGKIKIMFNLMKECTAELLEMIDMSMEKEEIEVKEMMARSVSQVFNLTFCHLKLINFFAGSLLML